MGAYRKGIETKQRIYNSAKKMFYQHGYRGATIERIAEDAGVPVGLVNYYFKKDEILVEMAREYSQSVKSAIEKQLENEPHNPLVRHILFTRIFYTIILGDEQSRSLYKEIFEERLIEAQEHDLCGRDLTEIIRCFDVDISESVCKRLIMAEYGARRELLSARFDKLDPVQGKDFINFLATISVRLAGISIKTVMKNVKKANELFDRADLSGLKLCAFVANPA